MANDSVIVADEKDAEEQHRHKKHKKEKKEKKAKKQKKEKRHRHHSDTERSISPKRKRYDDEGSRKHKETTG